MNYNGAWSHLLPIVLEWYSQGLSVAEIGDKLNAEHAHEFDRWTTSDHIKAVVRYMLKREGVIKPNQTNASAKPEHVSDDMDLMEWFKSQDKDEWPTGALTRSMHCLQNEGSFHTVGDLRAVTDSELMRIPNMGKASLTAIRSRLGYAKRKTPLAQVEARPPTHEELRLENEFLRGQVEGLRLALDAVIKGRNEPKSDSEPLP